MKQIRNYILVLTFLMVTGSVAAAPKKAFEKDEHSLLLCHFDNNTNADGTGSAALREGSATITTEGKIGGAAVLSRSPTPYSFMLNNGSLTYELKNAFPTSKGTVEFFVKPLSHDYQGKGRRILLFSYSSGDVKENIKIFYEVKPDGKRSSVYFYLLNPMQKKVLSMGVPSADFPLDKWHYIAVSWDTDNFYFLLDDKKFKFIKKFDLPSGGSGKCTLGGVYFHGLFDELRVSDVCRYKF